MQPDNDASLALGQRVGFTREGLLRSHSLVRGERKDMVLLSLLPGELAGDGSPRESGGGEASGGAPPEPA